MRTRTRHSNTRRGHTARRLSASLAGGRALPPPSSTPAPSHRGPPSLRAARAVLAAGTRVYQLYTAQGESTHTVAWCSLLIPGADWVSVSWDRGAQAEAHAVGDTPSDERGPEQ